MRPLRICAESCTLMDRIGDVRPRSNAQVRQHVNKESVVLWQFTWSTVYIFLQNSSSGRSVVSVRSILKPTIGNYLFYETGLQQLQLPIWMTFNFNAQEGTNIPFNHKNEIFPHGLNEIVKCCGLFWNQYTVIDVNNQNTIRWKKEAWVHNTWSETPLKQAQFLAFCANCMLPGEDHISSFWVWGHNRVKEPCDPHWTIDESHWWQNHVVFSYRHHNRCWPERRPGQSPLSAIDNPKEWSGWAWAGQCSTLPPVHKCAKSWHL